MAKRKTKEIRTVILENIFDKGRVPAVAIANQFGISRQAVAKNVRNLINEGLVLEEGLPGKKSYKLKSLQEILTPVEITPKTGEDEIWVRLVSEHLTDLKENVREICHYGFTEMFNNVIDHSQSHSADIYLTRDALVQRMTIKDHGVGIWKKLQEECNLTDARHAVLELSKGKLTTDPTRHTGEGIFFTSRMFDRYILESDRLSFCRFEEGYEWLFDVKEGNFGEGTRVIMVIRLDSERTTKEIFDKFASDFNDFGFTRTHLSVELAKYEGDHLISRSQAKRLLARLDRFQEVYLDFRGVSEIGQAFADEIFRVYRKEHPLVHIIPTNANEQVLKMIHRAIREYIDEPSLPLFDTPEEPTS